MISAEGLKSLADDQLSLARNAIKEGKSWSADVWLVNENRISVIMLIDPNPLQLARTVILSKKPEAYLFMSEGWIALMKLDDIPEFRRQSKQISTMENRMESLTQHCSNKTAFIDRTFIIDRMNRTFTDARSELPDSQSLSVLPRSW